MSKSDAILEKEAEELEKKSKLEASKKNLDVAILLLMDAKDIYLQLGFQGQVGILEKQIARYKRMMELENKPPIVSKIAGEKRQLEQEGNKLLEKAKNLVNENLYDNALNNFQAAYEIFEKLGLEYQSKQIRWQINQLKDKQITQIKKDVLNEKEGPISIAEERKLRIFMEQEEKQKKLQVERDKNLAQREKEQLMIEERRKELFEKTEGMRLKEEMERTRTQQLSVKHHNQRKQDLVEKEKKLRQLQEAKKQEEMKIQQAEKSLAKAKELLDSKEFQSAKEYYKEAIDLFTELKWIQQADILKKELKNIDIYETQYKEKLKEDFLKKKKQEKEFEKRVDSLLEEKRKKEAERQARMRALPPELKQKLDRAKMTLDKAEKELELKKYERVLARYEYVLEIYKSFQTDKIDLTNDISEVEGRISDLKSKM